MAGRGQAGSTGPGKGLGVHWTSENEPLWVLVMTTTMHAAGALPGAPGTPFTCSVSIPRFRVPSSEHCPSSRSHLALGKTTTEEPEEFKACLGALAPRQCWLVSRWKSLPTLTGVLSLY